ncbi:MAG: hypothetical protein ABI539_10815 [Acidobacteriota bacterium]
MKNKTSLQFDLAIVTAIIAAVTLGCSNFSKEAANSHNTVNSGSPSPSASPAANSAGTVEATPTPPPEAAHAVCPDPAKPCHHADKQFDEWELSFKMPTKLAPNKTYSSAPFYAVILEGYPIEDCDGGEFIEAVEAERRELQKSDATRKVFVSYECPNMAAVGYEFEGKRDAANELNIIGNFLAVYGGESKPEADALLRKFQSKYPKAAVKKMTATYEVIEQ